MLRLPASAVVGSGAAWAASDVLQLTSAASAAPSGADGGSHADNWTQQAGDDAQAASAADEEDYWGGAAAGADPDDEVVEADEGISPAEVVSRIEALVSTLVAGIAQGQLPELMMASRAPSNARLIAARGAATADSDGDATAASEVDGDGSGARRECRLALGGRTLTKTLLRAGGKQALSVARVLKVLEVVHDLLRSGRTCTQRDLYYRLATCAVFTAEREVAAAVQDAVALMRVPRGGLGICCAPRCAARYVLVIEKDAVFQRLVEDGLAARLPCVLVTGKGFPDLSTRAFLAHLHAVYPGLLLLGLVDWNPSGVTILCTYKYGTARMGLEAPRSALPSLRWLGVTSDMLADVPAPAFKPLSPRDGALLRGLRQRLAGRPQWLAELGEMEASGLKADIEALYEVVGVGGLAALLERRILQQGYLN